MAEGSVGPSASFPVGISGRENKEMRVSEGPALTEEAGQLTAEHWQGGKKALRARASLCDPVRLFGDRWKGVQGKAPLCARRVCWGRLWPFSCTILQLPSKVSAILSAVETGAQGS